MSSKANQKPKQDAKSSTKNVANPTPNYKEKLTKCKKDLDDANKQITQLNKDLELTQFELLFIRENFNYDEVRKKMPQMMDNDGLFADIQARLERDIATLHKEIEKYKSQQGKQTDGKANGKLDEDKEKLKEEVSELKKKNKELEEKNVLLKENRGNKKQTELSDEKEEEKMEEDKEELEKARKTIKNHERKILELETKIKGLEAENKDLKDRTKGRPEKAFDKLSNQIDAMANQANKITKLEKENQQLTAELQTEKNQTSTLKEENKQLNEKLMAAKDKGSNLEGENKQLNEKLSTNKGQGDTDLDTQLNELTRQIGDKERELNESKETYLKDLKDKDGQIWDKERELNKSKEAYQKELKEKDGTIKQNEDEKERLKRTIKQNEEEIERLKRDIQELKREAKSRQTSERKGSSTEKEKGDLKKIKELENERNTLISEAKQLNTKLKDYERQVEGLKTQLEEQKKTIEKMKDAHPKSGHSKQRELEKEITALKQSLKDAQQRGGNSRETELMEEVESLKTRLSKMAGAQLMDGNPNIADLSDTNRPTKLAEQYSELYDNEWTNAFEVLEEMGKSEIDIIERLLRILMDTYKFCIEVSKEQMRQMKRALTAVANRGEEIPDENIPVVKRRQLHDLRKAFAPDLIDSVFESYKEKNKPADIGNKDMKSYVHKCISLCWLMNVQDPPVVLDTKNHSGTFNGDVFRSYTKTGKTLAFVVWPALYIEQGGAMLAKGVAQGK